MKSFEINGGVKKELQAYLSKHRFDLKTVMENETSNRDIAAIIHKGLPVMIRKIYSLEKMQKFFWQKRELMYKFIVARLVDIHSTQKNIK